MSDLNNLPSNQLGPDDDWIYDPTLQSFMRSNSRLENPKPEEYEYVSGTKPPTLKDISLYTDTPEQGAIVLPSTIPLLNQSPNKPLSREAMHGVDLVFQSKQRATHIWVHGMTGVGKTTGFIEPARYSAIMDSEQIVLSLCLKPDDYGPVSEICKKAGKPLIVINLADAWRSIGWNPLATSDPDIAFDCIRRFTDSVKNPKSNESEFWNQWIQKGLFGAWQAGHRSFPHIFEFFSLPIKELISELKSHENSGSKELAEFLEGDSHNANTVLGSIRSAMVPFLSESVRRVMARDDLKLETRFEKPVCIHVEIPEVSLETFRPLVQMLARCLIDALIQAAEKTKKKIPATIFIDDLPSLGPLLSVERLLTLRSREISVVASVQSIAAVELAYGNASRALLEGFANKIVFPGLPQPDADYFSRDSGEQVVSLPCYEGGHPSFVTRPLLSATAIRSPDYSHYLLGKPVTLFLNGTTFQAYLQSSYELPEYARILRATRDITGRERLHRHQLPKPTLRKKKDSSNNQPGQTGCIPTNTRGWSEQRLRDAIEEGKKTIDWEKTKNSPARSWWEEFEDENKKRPSLIFRLVEELVARNSSITEFFHAFVYSSTENIQACLYFLDYLKMKEFAEKHKQESSEMELDSDKSS